MKKIKKLSAYILSVVFVMAFTGCALFGGGPSKSPEETLKESMSNIYSIHAGGYDLSFTGKSTGATPEEAFDFDVSLTGIFDTQEKAAPKFTMAADAKVKPGTENQMSVSAELRLTKDFLYGVLSAFDPGDGSELPAETQALLGKWYKMAVPPDTFADSPLPPASDAELTDYQKQMKDLIAKSSFFKEPTYVGTEKVEGVSTYHYKASLDKEGIKTFMTEAAKINGTEVTETDLADMDTTLNAMELSGDVWVGVDDMIIRKAKGTLSMVQEGTMNVNLTFELTLKDLNKAQAVTEPADALDFDPSVLFGAAAMMQSGGTLPVQ